MSSCEECSPEHHRWALPPLWCRSGYEKQNETANGYECKVPVLTWQPSYFAFGTPTTSDTEPPSGKNVFAAMDAEGNKGVCINRGGERHCFQTNNVEFEQQHVQEVFQDTSCSVYSSYVECNASDLYCIVGSNGYVRCRDNSMGGICNVYSDGDVTCD